MNEIVVEQAVVMRAEGGCRFLSRSAGFRVEWEAEMQRLVFGFGERPAGVVCPEAVFARPLNKSHVAIVKVSDQAGETPFLGYHFAVVPQTAYLGFGGDPFVLADRVAPAWHARGELPTISWPAEPLPRRTVADVRKVLQQTKAAALPEDAEVAPGPDGDAEHDGEALSPALLGGVQVLVDSGRLMFERSLPDNDLMRGLWTLLPRTTRSTLWPASFAFSTALGFDAVVVPPGVAGSAAGPRYTTEDQACEYPPGHYELALQVAAEAGNQADLDALFERRSSAETLRLGLALLVAVGILALATSWFQPAPRPPARKFTRPEGRALHITRMVGMANPWQASGLLVAGPDLWDTAEERP